ncbi:magnesium transporter [Cyanobacterium stanieri PCC 7202]|uniref:Magnesium transporter MgtE n=1 Tax=Cyanobacterium stanieri (strain ATCC 29140 / PCC 7202) TaxID=292563 RepID=K9YJS1_CYASC|nr:magnesium transporter [Cyanobacterium stanieri PCC 7202]
MNEQRSRISRYYGQLNPEDLFFNVNLQDFSHRVDLISSLQTGGKITPTEAIARINHIWEHIKDYQQNAGLDLPAVELAELLMQIEPEKRLFAFNSLVEQKAIAVFKCLRSEDQAGLIQSMEKEQVMELIPNLEADNLVRLFDELPNQLAEELIEQLAPQNRISVDILLKHPEGTVGRIMNLRQMAVLPSTTVENVLTAIQHSSLTANQLALIYIIDEQKYYRGFVRTVRLLRCDPNQTLENIMEGQNIAMATKDPDERAIKILRNNDLPALPVVDDQGRLIGNISFDDIIDLVEEDATDTALAQAGIGNLLSRDKVWSDRLVRGSITYAVRLRITFLIVTLIGGFVVGGVIENFEETLEVLPFAAVFIPLVMDMGGNVGTQSTTIFARGLAWDQINVRNFFPYFFRETRIGLMMGAILGLIAGVVGYFWQGVPNDVPQMGIVVAISLLSVVTLGAILGSLLPWVMLKLGFDHGPGADPFVTTIKDFVGLWIYFSLVVWLVGVV